MGESHGKITVYLEVGKKRTIVGALEWPGWHRSGRGEQEALERFLAAAPRYEKIALRARLPFAAPRALEDLVVTERFPGTATTEFGAPDALPSADQELLDPPALARATALLTACWEAFDEAVADARGHDLAKGPRGGGRDLDAMIEHVLGAESSYAARIGLKLGPVDPASAAALAAQRQAILEILAEIAVAGPPPPGPRGGKRWSASGFVRRAAYHLVDHIWEIADRVQ